MQNLISSVIVNFFHFLQISYAFISDGMDDKTQFSFFYRMLPKEEVHYTGIVKVIHYFRWTSVALVAPDTDNGERFLKTLTALLLENNICAVFSHSISGFQSNSFEMKFDLYVQWKQVNVFIYYAESTLQNIYFYGMEFVDQVLQFLLKPTTGKIWIVTAMWDLTVVLRHNTLQRVVSIFSFSIQAKKKMNYENLDHLLSSITGFIGNAFMCSHEKHPFSVKDWSKCKEKEQMTTLVEEEIEGTLSLNSHHIYNTIWAVARALSEARMSRSKRRILKEGGRIFELETLSPWQVLLSPSRTSPRNRIFTYNATYKNWSENT